MRVCGEGSRSYKLIAFPEGRAPFSIETGSAADLSRMDQQLIDDYTAGATRPVHDTTLADDEDCRPKATYEDLLNSGYAAGVRDYLAGPRLERFARGADEAGHILLATSDRETLINVVQDARHKLSLVPTDAHALRMAAAMLCSGIVGRITSIVTSAASSISTVASSTASVGLVSRQELTHIVRCRIWSTSLT